MQKSTFLVTFLLNRTTFWYKLTMDHTEQNFFSVLALVWANLVCCWRYSCMLLYDKFYTFGTNFVATCFTTKTFDRIAWNDPSSATSRMIVGVDVPGYSRRVLVAKCLSQHFKRFEADNFIFHTTFNIEYLIYFFWKSSTLNSVDLCQFLKNKVSITVFLFCSIRKTKATCPLDLTANSKAHEIFMKNLSSCISLKA